MRRNKKDISLYFSLFLDSKLQDTIFLFYRRIAGIL